LDCELDRINIYAVFKLDTKFDGKLNFKFELHQKNLSLYQLGVFHSVGIKYFEVNEYLILKFVKTIIYLCTIIVTFQ